jgi:hypothetical protein
MTRYPDWARVLITIALFLATAGARATGVGQIDADNPTQQLEIGRLTIDQKPTVSLRFVLSNGRRIDVSDTAGFYWPPVATDQQGRFYIGRASVDSRSGRLFRVNGDKKAIVLGSHYTVSADDVHRAVQIWRGAHECTIGIDKFGLGSANGRVSDFLRGVIRFVDADGPLVALVTLDGREAGDTHYLAVSILPDSCDVEATDLGNPDLLVEIGWTPRGHWWIAGSKEGTLIRSEDGRHWVTTHLPENISELTSAYVVAPGSIWLAANDAAQGISDNPELIYSEDNGKSWIPLTWNSQWMRNIPPYWLEGQMRARGKSVPDLK